MRFIIKLLLLVQFWGMILNAQEIYLCTSYSEDGTPIGVKNKFEIKPYGSAIYVLIDNDKKFNDPLLYMFIDKLVDDRFTPFDSKTIEVDETDTWAVTNFEFKEPGMYEIYFLNSSQNRLASIKAEVTVTAEFSNTFSNQLYNSQVDCEFIFCELVINGKPVNRFNTISLSNFGGQVFIYLDNKIQFGIDKIKVQIWKRSRENSNYEELVDTKKFRILPEWRDTFFKYVFTQVGEFKIDVLDSENNFIASNIITVQN